MKKKFENCPICKSINKKIKFSYTKKPLCETDFNIFKNGYSRHYFECLDCTHWYSNINLNLDKFYSEEYNNKTYKNSLLKTFNKIKNLKKKNSDNYFRVKRIEKFIKKNLNTEPNLLDIGSGIGIFPYEIKKLGWKCIANDPSLVTINHLKKNLKLQTLYGDFLKLNIIEKFNIITLNKVLEHVKNPNRFLNKAKKFLTKDGYMYLELPDIEKAKKISKNREEFAIEHIHGFTKKSIFTLLKKCDFKILKFDKICEPSTKYTSYVFCKKS
jgi:2-polyprenyl-3-methyl-5-hydroxy-6-metoxy-1,4-benzoquinol methylase